MYSCSTRCEAIRGGKVLISWVSRNEPVVPHGQQSARLSLSVSGRMGNAEVCQRVGLIMERGMRPSGSEFIDLCAMIMISRLLVTQLRNSRVMEPLLNLGEAHIKYRNYDFRSQVISIQNF